MRTNKNKVSYYDAKDKDDYITDDKNLTKIRNKSLKKFCEFVRLMEEIPVIWIMSGKENDLKKMENFGFAWRVINDLKKKDFKDWKEIEKIMGEEDICWIGKRAVYDYLHAYKFIKACRGRTDRLLLNMLQGQK